jgi:acyl transferase domain-containing protein
MARVTKPSEPIAIVGSSCRFAGHVNSPSKLWDLLCDAPDLSREVPSNRFSAKGFYHKDNEYHGTTNSIKAYWLEQDPGVFDAAFFNITPKEAEAMDPQQRLLLEVVFESMESAGFPLARYSGQEVGVFSGCMTQDYETLSARDELATSQYFPTGNARSIMSNRISYCFNFQGPSMTIDTACSSSLVALHQAMLSLRTGGCVMACVTGANLMLTPEHFIVESTLRMLSPSGKCHMWDIGADGYARGEGFASVLLKPLSRAIADGDRIEAVIREVGINADGKTNGITMPNPAAQASLIRTTYRRAGLDPTNPSDRCQYFEAHGTGTAAGDPQEAAAIHEAFFSGADPNGHGSTGRKMLVGSVKTVIGHTEAAAGLAGVLKTVWSMKHGLIPPNLHFKALSPSVEPYYTHLQIPTAIVPWPDPPPGQPRRASVNSFGFGGANAHAIIESYTPQMHGADSSVIGCSETCESESDVPASALAQLHSSPHPGNDAYPFSLPIVISAASLKSLRDVVQSYRTWLAQNDVSIHELAWHQYLRRAALPYRISFSAASTLEALEALDSLLLLDELAIPTAYAARSRIAKPLLRILGIFTGQGAQWPTMSRSLFQQNGVYRDTIRKLDAVLKVCPHPCPWTLEEQIMAGKDVSRIHEAAIAQPLCTALQIALVDFMRSIGIDFHTVIGHSSGEIAAAYAAGRLSAEDAIVVSYYRGMVAHLAYGSGCQRGAMLAAGMSQSEAVDFCSGSRFDGRICIAARNSPTSVTLSGDFDTIHLAHKALNEKKKFSQVLRVDTAYHSQHMANPAVQYIKLMREYGVRPVQKGNGVIWISSVEHRPRTGAQDLDCQYWADNMVHQVQFHDAVEYALSQPDTEFDCAIEIGPHPALQGPVAQTAKALGHDILYSCPLNRTKDGGLAVAEFLGFVWSNFGSSKVDLRRYIEQSPMPNLVQSRLDNLPHYPFNHSVSHWRECRISRQYHFRSAAPHELLGVRSREDNEYELKWRNVLKLDKIPWLEHHSFQGQALLPASAYCVMALDATRYFLDGRPASLVELRDVQILSGIAIDDKSPGIETLFSLTISPIAKDSPTIDAVFNLYSCPADGTTKMKRDVSGSLHIVLGEPFIDALPPRSPCLSETMSADPRAFYEMMEMTGLMYTGPFRALTSIQRRYRYCSTTLARMHPDDTTTLETSPATLDSCFQSAFLSYASPGDE